MGFELGSTGYRKRSRWPLKQILNFFLLSQNLKNLSSRDFLDGYFHHEGSSRRARSTMKRSFNLIRFRIQFITVYCRQPVWPVKSCQMSIKIAQKLFHKKTLKTFSPFQNLQKNVGNLGKIIVATCFESCPKCNKSPNLITLIAAFFHFVPQTFSFFVM